MIRVNFYLSEEEKEFLDGLPGKTSDHIRRAVYEYKISMQKVMVSASKSKLKGGK